MGKIKFRVTKDKNELMYIPIIRKLTDIALSEVRESLNNNDYTNICNLNEIEEL